LTDLAFPLRSIEFGSVGLALGSGTDVAVGEDPGTVVNREGVRSWVWETLSVLLDLDPGI
jgi:hypothetical protein